MRKLTYRKADRALLAIAALIEGEGITPREIQEMDRAADAVRAIRDRLPA